MFFVLTFTPVMVKSPFYHFTESGKIIKMDLVISSQVKMNSGLAMIIFMPCSTMVRGMNLRGMSLSLLLFCSTIIFSKSSLGEHTMKIELMDWKGGRSYAMYDNFRVSDEKVS